METKGAIQNVQSKDIGKLCTQETGHTHQKIEMISNGFPPKINQSTNPCAREGLLECHCFIWLQIIIVTNWLRNIFFENHSLLENRVALFYQLFHPNWSLGIDGDNLSIKTHTPCKTYRECHHGIYYIVTEGRHLIIKN